MMITHPEKVLFPESGITKGELAAYYEDMARVILPHLRGRPVTMERYPAGIGREGFWQKDVSKGFPEWLERVTVPKKKGVVHYPIITDLRSLLWMTNQNTITQHVWTSRVPRLKFPDLCVFDLDPSTNDVAAVRKAAVDLRDLLEELGLPSWVKTSGSKGFHIVVPLDGKTPNDVVVRFADATGRLFVSRSPDRFTQEFSKADRGGRIYVDTGRNGYTATFAAAYTVRARPHAPVSAPCTWPEVERGTIGPATLTIRDMRQRVSDVGDLWAEMRRRGRSLGRATQRLRRAMAAVMALVALSCAEAAPRTQTSPDRTVERSRMIETQLKSRDITHPGVLDAMRRVPRHLFVPEALQNRAYDDTPLPIGEDQTISQPYIVAYMTQALEPAATDRVLEIGTGSGYQAAVLAELVKEVYTIEIVPALAQRAKALLEQLKYTNIHTREGDGYAGWPEAAPFDKIIVTAAPDDIPQALVDQLAVGGLMVVPVGRSFQVMTLLRKTPAGIVKRETIEVRFVPMVKKIK